MNNFSLQNIVRKHILSLAPYSSARDEYTGKEGTFLDANENPLGSATPENWNRYPDPYQWEIKEKLAPMKGCRPTQIFLGNGSDEPIDLIIRLTCEPQQDNIIILPPTYGMYEEFLEHQFSLVDFRWSIFELLLQTLALKLIKGLIK